MKALILPIVPEARQEGLLVFQEVVDSLHKIEKPLLELQQGRVALIVDDLILCEGVREVLLFLAFHHGLIELENFRLNLLLVRIFLLGVNQLVNLLYELADSLLDDCIEVLTVLVVPLLFIGQVFLERESII